MKRRELYYDKIFINETISIQIDEFDNDFINIIKNDEIIDKFKVNRKIYTLFKVIQDYTNDDDYVIVEDTQSKVYGKEIYLYEDIYMSVNPNHACLTVDFYKKINEDEIKLIYLTKMIYTTQKFFHMILIPKKLKATPNYYITNVFKFIDMIEILRYEKN